MSRSYEIKYLQSLVDDDPSNWAVRKEAALKLYEAGEYLNAANMVWRTPEIPSTDMDVAFAVKIVSRARPNRSIRLVYEVLTRNAGKAEQSIAIANVFNLIGFPMLAARFYGGAMVLNAEYFDIGFELDALFADNSKLLKKSWAEHSGNDNKKSFSVVRKELVGESIRFGELKNELSEGSFKNASEAAAIGDTENLGAALQKFKQITTELKSSEEEEVRRLVLPKEPMRKALAVSDETEVRARAPKLRFLPPIVNGDKN